MGQNTQRTPGWCLVLAAGIGVTSALSEAPAHAGPDLVSSATPTATGPATTANPIGARPDSDRRPPLPLRADLLDALRALRRDASRIEVHCAKCYSMAAPDPTVDYTCSRCGKTATHARATQAGELAAGLPNLTRSFDHLATAMSIDATALCPTCGAGRPPELVLTFRCAGCGEVPIRWTIADARAINTAGWLALEPPMKPLDGTALGVRPGDATGIASGARFIYQHRFCANCQREWPLDPNAPSNPDDSLSQEPDDLRGIPRDSGGTR